MSQNQNSLQIIHVFSDGSFCPKTKIGILGVAIYFNTKLHQENHVNSAKNYYDQLTETSCSRVELRSAIMSMRILKDLIDKQILEKSGLKILLCLDNQAIIDLPTRRQRLEVQSYRSQRTGIVLSSAGLYREFFTHYDELNPTLIWIKGHTSKNRTQAEDQFRKLDLSVRKKLRSAVKNEDASISD